MTGGLKTANKKHIHSNNNFQYLYIANIERAKIPVSGGVNGFHLGEHGKPWYGCFKGNMQCLKAGTFHKTAASGLGSGGNFKALTRNWYFTQVKLPVRKRGVCTSISSEYGVTRKNRDLWLFIAVWTAMWSTPVVFGSFADSRRAYAIMNCPSCGVIGVVCGQSFLATGLITETSISCT